MLATFIYKCGTTPVGNCGSAHDHDPTVMFRFLLTIPPVSKIRFSNKIHCKTQLDLPVDLLHASGFNNVLAPAGFAVGIG